MCKSCDFAGYEGIGTCWKSGEAVRCGMGRWLARCWTGPDLCTDFAGQDRIPPKGTRFSAHGGELGVP